MKCLTALFAMLIASAASQAAIVLNSSCSATFGSNTSSESGGPSCVAVADNNIGYPFSTASASITGMETVSPVGSPAPPSSISYTFSETTGGLGYDATASVSGSDSLTLYTAGPVRQGELTFDEGTSLAGHDSSLSTTLVIGSLFTHCTESANTYPGCTGNFGSPVGEGSMTVPFTLGQPFAFDFRVSSDVSGGITQHVGNGDVSFSFNLFEADGTTPVQVLTPEPSTIGCIACGLLGLLAMPLRKTRIIK